MAVSGSHNGFFADKANSELNVYYRGTEVAKITATAFNSTGTITGTAITATTGGLTVTAGNLTITAGDDRITAGNARLGAVSAFATTEPTSAVIFKSGTAPVGAIATSGALYANATVLLKMIADGTESNVET